MEQELLQELNAKFRKRSLGDIVSFTVPDKSHMAREIEKRFIKVQRENLSGERDNMRFRIGCGNVELVESNYYKHSDRLRFFFKLIKKHL